MATAPGCADRPLLRVAEFGEAGVELAIVYLRPPHTPAALEPLAEALAQLADA